MMSIEGIKEVSALFLKERHALLAYIYALCRDAHVAEDILQEVWIKLAEAVEKGVAVQKPIEWSRGTARHLLLHHWRGQRNAKVVGDSEILDLVDQAFRETDLAEEGWRNRREALTRCLEELPPRSKEMLDLKYDKQLSAAEIGRELEKNAAAVLMALSRIRRVLMECIEKRVQLSGA